MLKLVTSNPLKYAPFKKDLESWRIVFEQPGEALPEIQAASFGEALAAKAQAAAAAFGHPVLIDDSGLTLQAYPSFPGPLTSVVLRSLGTAGLKRLLDGVTDRAAMECHIGCWIDGALQSWTGRVEGRLDLSRTPRNPRMMLTDLFVPDQEQPPGELLHRAAALKALGKDVFDLHLRLSPTPSFPPQCSPGQCPFCIEIDDPSLSIFAEMLDGRLESRVVYEDDDFIVLPAIGQFTEGGLLLLTRAHIPSFAFLPPHLYPRLETMISRIGKIVSECWGTPPIFFEHGPGLQQSKGGCCVDHAHFNIFPARAQVQRHLASRMQTPIAELTAMERLRAAEFGYLFVQENDGTRNVFDGKDTPSQLVRRIVTSEIGKPERWHWRDYPGCDELIATYNKLKGLL